MNKKFIYTVGYTLFQQGNTIDIENLFEILKKYKQSMFGIKNMFGVMR